MRVKVIHKDVHHGDWDEPFEGQLKGFVNAGDGSPCAVVAHPKGRLFLVPITLLQESRNRHKVTLVLLVLIYLGLTIYLFGR